MSSPGLRTTARAKAALRSSRSRINRIVVKKEPHPVHKDGKDKRGFKKISGRAATGFPHPYAGCSSHPTIGMGVGAVNKLSH